MKGLLFKYKCRIIIKSIEKIIYTREKLNEVFTDFCLRMTTAGDRAAGSGGTDASNYVPARLQALPVRLTFQIHRGART
jgi:hypothetical protein